MIRNKSIFFINAKKKRVMDKVKTHMFSFHRGIPFAKLKVKGGGLKTLHYHPKEETPDLLLGKEDKLSSIIDENDLFSVSKKLKLNSAEVKLFKTYLDSPDPKTMRESLPTNLKKAAAAVDRIINEKLRFDLEFESGDELEPIYNKGEFNRHWFIVGPSGSGKSTLAAKLLEGDSSKRPVNIVSKVQKDKAFEHLFDQKKHKDRFTQIRLDSSEDVLSALPNKELLKEKYENGCIFLFDDIFTLSPMDLDIIKDYEEDLLETGRHKNVSVITTSHQLNKPNRSTRKNIDEAEFIVLFPSTNAMTMERFMRNNLGLLKGERDKILNKVKKYRYMIIKLSTPNIIMTDRSAYML